MIKKAITLLLCLSEPSWSAFGYYKSATLDHTQAGTADSTDWPLTIGLDGNIQAADTDLKTVGNGGFVQNASGFDIRPYSDNACSSALTYQLVYYQATTGKLEMHVKIPTLNHSSDTVIYLCFGDSGISTDGSSNTTWNSNYKLVQHLKDGTSLTLTDSSQSSNNGTNHNTVTASAGKIDGGGTFVAASSQYLDFGTDSSLDITGALTASAWAKTSTSANFQIIMAKLNIGVGASNYKFHIYFDQTAGTISCYLGDTSGTSSLTRTTTSAFNDGNWHLIDLVFSPSARGEIWVDGVIPSQTTVGVIPTALIGSAAPLTMGADSDPIFFFDGSLDEGRLMNTDLSGSWILSDYNSQKPSSTFIAWGAKVSIGGASAAGINKRMKIERMED